jgi:hypothetical protein
MKSCAQKSTHTLKNFRANFAAKPPCRKIGGIVGRRKRRSIVAVQALRDVQTPSQRAKCLDCVCFSTAYYTRGVILKNGETFCAPVPSIRVNTLWLA